MLVSQSKLEANRRNARRSTGPRTREGKARSAMNAVKHGMCAASVCVRGEESATFEAMLGQLLEEHRPRTGTAFALVYRLALATWNLRRLAEAETQLIDEHTLRHFPRQPVMNAPPPPPPAVVPIGEAMLRLVSPDSKYGLLQLYQSRLERQFYRALSELRRIQKDAAAGASAGEAIDEIEAGEPVGDESTGTATSAEQTKPSDNETADCENPDGPNEPNPDSDGIAAADEASRTNEPNPDSDGVSAVDEASRTNEPKSDDGPPAASPVPAEDVLDDDAAWEDQTNPNRAAGEGQPSPAEEADRTKEPRPDSDGVAAAGEADRTNDPNARVRPRCVDRCPQDDPDAWEGGGRCKLLCVHL